MENYYREKLAKYVFFIINLGIILAFCWYFRTLLGYVALAIVVSLISRPVSDLIANVKVNGRSAVPRWMRNLFSAIVILLALFAAIAGLFPVMTKLVSNFSEVVSGPMESSVLPYFDSANEFIVKSFPVDKDFNLADIAMEQLNEIADISLFKTLLGSVASTLASVGMALFIIIFISYFFIRDRYLLKRFICAIVPDEMENKVRRSIGQCGQLLSRYFAGLVLEMTIVGLIDFLGLWAFAKLDFPTALGIGFMAGLLNIIPYLGPWIGAALGTITALVLAINGAAVMAGGSIWTFVLILLAVFVVAQLVDNYLLQPIIYSKSIKASPLEIFFVILIAGYVGGVVGMLAAIPVYTVIRVFAVNLFPDNKFVRFLES